MDTMKTILSIAGGVGAGLAVGYLTAPRSGKKTREKIVHDAEETRKNMEAAIAAKLREAKELINKSVGRAEENGQAVLEEAKEATS